MGKLNCLVLGDGILGSEITNQMKCDFVSRKKDNLDISNPQSWNFNNYKIIINCVANTNTYSKDRDEHWLVNYKFVHDLIIYCNTNNIKLVHISTSYLYDGSLDNASENDVPSHSKNWYGYTKLLGDGLVQLLSNNYLICRCMHKLKPFPYKQAWIDQIGNFDYVDVISNLIVNMIDKKLAGVYNVGTNTKSMFELASETASVTPIKSPDEAPKNISMNISKLQNNLTNPFFSIAIPAYGYNGKGVEFLAHSFDILEEQLFSDFEVVISDHSTDDTIKNFCQKWDDKLNIKYIRNTNGRGVISPNLNVALENCSGTWIKILFQDDFLYDENSLLITKNFIESNEDKNWIATRFCHTSDGKNLYRDFYPRWVDNIWSGNNLIGCPSVICIKNDNILLFDEGLNWLMDCDYYKRVYDTYGEPGIISEYTVVNRSNTDRLTNTITDEVKNLEHQKMNDKYGKKHLPNVTLIAMTSVRINETIKALEYSCRGINFGAVKIVTNELPLNLPNFIQYEFIDKISNIDEWNYAAIYKLGKYVDTDFAILIHDDGFIVNPESWKDDFLNYDYIGAPWGLPNDNYSFRDINGEIIRVGNSVSLRSKRLIDLPVKLNLEWKPFHGYYNEDGYICVNYRHIYLENGMKYAGIDVAKFFSHESMLPETIGIKPFAFHRYNGTNQIYPRF